MVTIAVVMGLLAIITGQALGYPLRDPEGFLGPAWFLAIVAAARAAMPGVPHKPVLDCADAPGQALAALRAGVPEVVLDPACPAFAQVAAVAAALGARIRDRRPRSLDLGPLDLTRAGARAKLAAWLSGAG